jgi:hypothetical protein
MNQVRSSEFTLWRYLSGTPAAAAAVRVFARPQSALLFTTFEIFWRDGASNDATADDTWDIQTAVFDGSAWQPLTALDLARPLTPAATVPGDRWEVGATVADCLVATVHLTGAYTRDSSELVGRVTFKPAVDMCPLRWARLSSAAEAWADAPAAMDLL